MADQSERRGFTPGPWRKDETPGVGWDIQSFGTPERYDVTGPVYREEDAALIAAAPFTSCCDGPINGPNQVSTDAKRERLVMTNVWLVRHYHGWCATRDLSKVTPPATDVQTACGRRIPFILGSREGEPTCEDCKKALERASFSISKTLKNNPNTKSDDD